MNALNWLMGLCLVGTLQIPIACTELERGRGPGGSQRHQRTSPPGTTHSEPGPQSDATGDFTTRLGVQGSPSPEQIASLGIESVRVMLRDHQISQAARRGAAGLDYLREFKRAGVEVIVCIRWPADRRTPREVIDAGGRRQDTHVDRIPSGREREEALGLLENFLVSTNGLVDWYQLGNEVLSGPGRYSRQQWRSGEALDWLEALATRAREVIRRENLPVRIASPGLHSIRPDVAGEAGLAVDTLIRFAGEHCDAIDIHLHVRGIDELVESVEHFRTRMRRQNVDLPLMALEWSMSGATKEWFQQDQSRREFVRSAYDSPADLGTWQKFVQEGPYDRDFMRRSYEYLNEQGFLAVCWAPLSQYGSPVYDVTALLAQTTVRRRHIPNEPFYSDYRRLVVEIRRRRGEQ